MTQGRSEVKEQIDKRKSEQMTRAIIEIVVEIHRDGDHHNTEQTEGDGRLPGVEGFSTSLFLLLLSSSSSSSPSLHDETIAPPPAWSEMVGVE